MQRNAEIEFFDFDCPEQPLGKDTLPAPRPPYRPRQITATSSDARLECFDSEVADANAQTSTIGPDLDSFVVGLLDSSAIQKFQDNRKAELTFADACRFWGITENLRAAEVDEKLTFVVTNLTELSRTWTETGKLPFSGRILAVADIRLLLSAFFHLEDRFERHLQLMRGRRLSG
jgi:hypothetical protein